MINPLGKVMQLASVVGIVSSQGMDVDEGWHLKYNKHKRGYSLILLDRSYYVVSPTS